MEGEYELQLTADGTGIHDAAGNAIAADAVETWIIDTSPPTADIIDVDPDPRGAAVDQIEIVFSEAVTGFDVDDLDLVRDGGNDLLTGLESLTSSDGIVWTLSGLGTLTTPQGDYTLTLTAAGSGIKNVLDYPLDGDAADSWVNGINSSPYLIEDIADVTVDEDDSDDVLDLSATFGEDDIGDVLVLSVSANTNPGLVAASTDGTDLTLSYVPDQ